MPVTKKQKTQILNALTAEMQSAKSIIFADFQGLSVKDLSQMRAKMREKGVKYHVAKKTLIAIAAKELGYDNIPDSLLTGPIGIALSMDDELSAAKIIYETAKKNDKLKLRGALFEGKVLDLIQTKQLATLPSKEELIVKLLWTLKSPISGFHGVLHGTLSGFVRSLSAIADKKQAASA